MKNSVNKESFPRRPRLWLGGIILCLVLVNLVSAFWDETPYQNDSLDHFAGAWNYAQAMKGNGPSLAELILEPMRKPPLVKIISSVPLLFYRWLPDPDITLFALQAIFAFLLISVYAACRRLAPDEPPAVALLAVFATGVSPAIFGMSKTVMTDLPLAAMVWAACAFLVSSDGFRRLWMSACFGVACGLGLLAKQTFPVFLVGPLLIVLAISLKRREKTGRVILGLVLAGLATAIVAGPWYANAFQMSFADNLVDNTLPTGIGDLRISFLLVSWIWENQMGWALFALSAIGCLLLLLKTRRQKRYGLLLIAFGFSLVFPLVFFSSIGKPIARHLLAVVPVFAICMSVGLFGTRGDGVWSKPAKALVALVVVLGTLQFGFLSFGHLPWNTDRTFWESALALPKAGHYPGGTNVGVFGINEKGVDARTLSPILLQSGLTHPRLLLAGQGTFSDLADDLKENCLVPKGECEVSLASSEYDLRGLAENPDAFGNYDYLVFELPCYRCRGEGPLAELLHKAESNMERIVAYLNKRGHVLVFKSRKAKAINDPGTI